MAAIPQQDLRASEAHERLLHRPGDQRRLASRRSPRPTRRWSSGSSSWPGSRPSSGRTECLMGLWDADPRAQPATRPPTSTRCSWCRARRSRCRPAAGLDPDRRPARSASGPPTGPAFRQTQADVVELLDADAGGARRPDQHRRLRLHLADRRTATTPTDVGRLCTDLHAVNTALEEQGFGSGLLCSLVPFADAGGSPGRAGLPLQAGHVLPVRPDRPAAARQPARDPGPRRPGRRAADREGPPALAGRVGRPGL